MTSGLTYPLVYLITDGSAADETFDPARQRILNTIELAIAEGVSLVQIREKMLSARLLIELVRDAAAMTHGSATRLLVNDRADVALAAGADGVHLAANSLPVSVIRKHFPAYFIIGVSAHNLEDVQAAAAAEADLAVFGPVFDTPGKGAAKGVASLSNACTKLWPFPVLALGGIDRTNWRTVIEAGAAGFAAIRSLNDPDSLRAIMEAVRDEFRQQN